METQHTYWTIDHLVKIIGKIDFPEFQREPTVWKLDKKQRLIDSIFRDFDISSIYLHVKEDGGYDCIDGRQRLNAIFSFLGINGSDEEHNAFNLHIENEIYDDKGKFDDIESKRFESIEHTAWGSKFMNYKLNIVEITEAKEEEELNLLFLRLQISSVLNSGEKLHAMTGDMREAIFYDISKHPFFKKESGIDIPAKRYAQEQVAAQIALNEFSLRDDGEYHRSRYVDLQEFFKTYSKFKPDDKLTIQIIKGNLDLLSKHFLKKLGFITNRAMAVSVYLFISKLVKNAKNEEINEFVVFFEAFLKTLKWQLPLGVQMHFAYHELLKFQTNITQAAGEKSAIERRQAFLEEYFYFYKKTKTIKGDDEYFEDTHERAEAPRKLIQLK